MENKYATFFGGAIDDKTTKEYSDSVSIGAFLASNGYILKNGGYRGLMEASSFGATQVGGTVIGYTCKSFGFTKGNDYLTQTIVCSDIYDRLGYLISNSEIFIVQRGGIGTLAELFLLLDETRKKKENKPKIFVFGEQWSKLFNSLTDVMTEEQRNMIIFCEDFEDFKNKFND